MLMTFYLSIVTLLLMPLASVAWNPSNSYAPSNVSCPGHDLVRDASSISSNESEWITERKSQIRSVQIEFLERLNMTDFSPSSFLSNLTIPIGLAFSGGGYRAMLCGAGQLAALDSRTINSTTNSSHLGGLLQSTTYLAGLSGGNWLVGSIVLNNFTTVQDLQGDSDVWDLEHSIINPGGSNIFSTASYYDDLVDDIDDKRDAGFEVSITDIWGRGLSQQFINLTRGGPALQFSDIRNFDAFTSHKMPFPIHVADGRAPNTTVISLNSTVFEFNPFEMGTWDPSLFSFADLKYIGSNVSNGSSTTDTCVTGFDNAGFVLGTSSSLFNQFILQLNSSGIEGVLYSLAEDILQDLSSDDDDIAVYKPNPFADTEWGLNGTENVIANDEVLDLVDGGEDLQNVPLHPLVQPARDVDVVFAFDNSADTDSYWPNGASIAATYARQFGKNANGTIFPYVPDNRTFINNGLSLQPVFFGCDISNMSSLYDEVDDANRDYTPPLIVYICNSAYSYFSNVSTFKMSYEQNEMAGMITNGYNVATQSNGTFDSEWGACVGCAIIHRETQRRNQSMTEQCQKCMSKYCWNGELNTTDNGLDSKNNNQTLRVSQSGASMVGSTSSLVVAAVLVTLSLLF